MSWQLALFYAVLGVPFLLGALKLKLWTALLVPVLCLAYGVVEFLNLHPEYDMKAIALVWGCFMAVASALAWLMGRALSDTLRSALGAIVRPLSARNDDGR